MCGNAKIFGCSCVIASRDGLSRQEYESTRRKETTQKDKTVNLHSRIDVATMCRCYTPQRFIPEIKKGQESEKIIFDVCACARVRACVCLF